MPEAVDGKNTLDKRLNLYKRKVDFYIAEFADTREELTSIQEQILSARTKQEKRAAIKATKELLASTDFETSVEKKDEWLTEKAEAGFAIIELVRQHPEANINIDELKPRTVIVNNTHLLAKMESDKLLWAEVKTHAQTGSDISALMESEEFGLGDLTSLKGLGTARRAIGRDVMKIVPGNLKKHPEIVAKIALITAAVGFGVWLFGSGHKKMGSLIAGGGLIGGLSAFLGFSSWGASLGEKGMKYAEGKVRKLVGDENVDAALETGASAKIMAGAAKDKLKDKWEDGKEFLAERKEEGRLEEEKELANVSVEERNYSDWTEEKEKEIKKRSYADAMFYRWMRLYMGRSIFTKGIELAHQGELVEKTNRLEKGGSLTGEEQLGLFVSLGVGDTVVQVGAQTGMSIIGLGGLFVWKNVEKSAGFGVLLKDFLLAEERLPAGTKLIGNYVGNALYFGGIATLLDLRATIANPKLSSSILESILREGIKKGGTWPIYAINLSGKMIQGTADFFRQNKLGKPHLLGHLNFLGKKLELISTAGRKVAEFSVSGLVRGGKGVIIELGKEAKQKAVQKAKKEAVKKALKEVAQDIGKKIPDAGKQLTREMAKALTRETVKKATIEAAKNVSKLAIAKVAGGILLKRALGPIGYAYEAYQIGSTMYDHYQTNKHLDSLKGSFEMGKLRNFEATHKPTGEIKLDGAHQDLITKGQKLKDIIPEIKDGHIFLSLQNTSAKETLKIKDGKVVQISINTFNKEEKKGILAGSWQERHIDLAEPVPVLDFLGAVGINLSKVVKEK